MDVAGADGMAATVGMVVTGVITVAMAGMVAITAVTAVMGDGLSSALESDLAGIIQVTLITDTRLTVIPMSILSRRTSTLQLRFIARRSQSPLPQLRRPGRQQRRCRPTFTPSQLLHQWPKQLRDPHRSQQRLQPR